MVVETLSADWTCRLLRGENLLHFSASLAARWGNETGNQVVSGQTSYIQNLENFLKDLPGLDFFFFSGLKLDHQYRSKILLSVWMREEGVSSNYKTKW